MMIIDKTILAKAPLVYNENIKSSLKKAPEEVQALAATLIETLESLEQQLYFYGYNKAGGVLFETAEIIENITQHIGENDGCSDHGDS